MKKEHYRALSAVFPVILKKDGERVSLLLHRRANTGYMDGLWDIAGSGHVDLGETAVQALARECREELGIDLEPDGLRFAHLSHNVDPDGAETYYNIYFWVDAYRGVPQILEPDKCAALEWFDVRELPQDMIPVRRADVEHCLRAELYTEYVNEADGRCF